MPRCGNAKETCKHLQGILRSFSCSYPSRFWRTLVALCPADVSSQTWVFSTHDFQTISFSVKRGENPGFSPSEEDTVTVGEKGLGSLGLSTEPPRRSSLPKWVSVSYPGRRPDLRQLTCDTHRASANGRDRGENGLEVCATDTKQPFWAQARSQTRIWPSSFNHSGINCSYFFLGHLKNPTTLWGGFFVCFIWFLTIRCGSDLPMFPQRRTLCGPSCRNPWTACFPNSLNVPSAFACAEYGAFVNPTTFSCTFTFNDWIETNVQLKWILSQKTRVER